MPEIKDKIIKFIFNVDHIFLTVWDRYPLGLVKSNTSIEKIKKACEITDSIFEKICARKDLIRMTERELRDFILYEIKEKGLKPSFPPIVTSGQRAGNEIHPSVTNTLLSGFTIIDLGVRYKGFCSDMTRTIYIGEPHEEEKILYNSVRKAEELGITIAHIGERCAFVDKVVRESLGEDAQYFIHTLGHGVGRFIHEPPLLFYKRDKHILKEHMVITIEPGIYIKNKLGIRIEDTCLITKNGCISLTQSPKKLIVIR